jgi:hypothetical protein
MQVPCQWELCPLHFHHSSTNACAQIFAPLSMRAVEGCLASKRPRWLFSKNVGIILVPVITSIDACKVTIISNLWFLLSPFQIIPVKLE